MVFASEASTYFNNAFEISLPIEVIEVADKRCKELTKGFLC